jgi:Helicase conserved C-terminal domain
VDLIAREVEAVYPGQGVVVLRGGDHGAKLAAERRFRQKDGPRVLVCTAAGREGINLQFARILFNFDLPWNPMDVEQRIGRIHRYGQRDAAQVYNLILSDTIEGRIFLLLNDKLTKIARTLGKVDESGNIAEDLRSQILGQLSERLNYDKLYQAALSDPELERTKLELEAALSNASEARQVVFALFQDLEGFSLDEYRPFSDVRSSLTRLREFLNIALAERGQRLVPTGDGLFDLRNGDGSTLARFTDDRERAANADDLELLGLDHPLVSDCLARSLATPPEQLGAAVETAGSENVIVSWWHVEAMNTQGEKRTLLQTLAIRPDGVRQPQIEHTADKIFQLQPSSPNLDVRQRVSLLHEVVEPALQRELRHLGVLTDENSLSAELIGWVETSAC